MNGYDRFCLGETEIPIPPDFERKRDRASDDAYCIAHKYWKDDT